MFRQWFDRDSSTYTYLLADSSGQAILIDPVLGQVDRDVQLIGEMGLTLAWVVDTHVHADHITAAHQLRQLTGCKVAYPATTEVDGADRLLGHREHLVVGDLDLQCRHTPGHTSGSACYLDMKHRRVFTGDTLLIRGCGRTDFQGGSAANLYRSVTSELFTLDDDVLVYPGHDYKGRTVSTIGEERAHNPRLKQGRSLEEFEQIMAGLKLSYPKKMDQAVPANRRLGDTAHAWSLLVKAPCGAVQAPIPWVKQMTDAVRLIDVREPDEYNGPLGHVPGAELVPLGSLEATAKDWDRDQGLVVICHSGKRSDKGALALSAMGFSRVASMTGGTSGYMQGSAGAGGPPTSCG